MKTWNELNLAFLLHVCINDLMAILLLLTDSVELNVWGACTVCLRPPSACCICVISYSIVHR